MSKFLINVENDTLTLTKQRARMRENDHMVFDLNNFSEEEPSIRTTMKITKKKDLHTVYYHQRIGDKVLLVFGAEKYVHVGFAKPEILYKKLIKAYAFATKTKLNRSGFGIWFKGYIYNPYGLQIENMQVSLSEQNSKSISLPISHNKIRRRQMLFSKNYHVHFSLDELLYENASINCNVMINLEIDGIQVDFPMSDGWIKIKNKRENYIPQKAHYFNDWALHVRKSRPGNLVLVRRHKEEIENSSSFHLKENPFVSFVMYHLGKLKKKFSKKKVNLFYEKFASKAEEGAYDLFLKAKKLDTSSNYFIIDVNSSDYPRIKNEKGVVAKYSWKYYWLLYTSDAFIATEAPIHINIVRSNNKYFRKSTFEKKFIFLQHGVTYLKAHEANSPFVNGKEATPSYIVVGSEKEKDIVADMLDLKEEQCLVCGLPVFSNIKWENMNQDSDDHVTVMLTWKPYEEFITDFEQTSYYKNTVALFEMLRKYLPDEKITIIPHPKIAHLMANTPLQKRVWKNEISAALAKSKLLITDYSSVCYNSFYQGGGVVFFQPDLNYYEEVNGKLIPNDEEYIGYRAFDLETLDKILSGGLSEQKVDLSYFRTQEFIERYLRINSFTDGKNLERILKSLQKIHVV